MARSVFIFVGRESNTWLSSGEQWGRREEGGGRREEGGERRKERGGGRKKGEGRGKVDKGQMTSAMFFVEHFDLDFSTPHWFLYV